MNWFCFFAMMIIPLSMLLWGYVLKKHCPSDINGVFGYRTSRSSKNEDTWLYANTRFGTLWIIIGIPLTAITAVAFFIFSKSTQLDTVLTCTMLVQLVIMLAPIAVVEKELKAKF